MAISKVNRPKAIAFLNKMRGGGQAHLISCDDGYAYVVKFKENPQHPRVLANEWIATRLLQRIGVRTPVPAQIEISKEFLAAHPDVCVQLAGGIRSVSAGLHFGSRRPGDPTRTAVFDFLGAKRLRNVSNRCDFVGALVFDCWVGNADHRQAIFVFDALNESPLGLPVAEMIDNGHCFNLGEWNFEVPALRCLYQDREVYQGIVSENETRRWMERIQRIPEREIWSLANEIPEQWVPDQKPLHRLLEQLIQRREWLAHKVSSAAAHMHRLTVESPKSGLGERTSCTMVQTCAAGTTFRA